MLEGMPFSIAYMVPLCTVDGPPATELIMTMLDFPAAFSRGCASCSRSLRTQIIASCLMQGPRLFQKLIASRYI